MTNASSTAIKQTEQNRSSSKPKQAVVVIHGMGEQRPMETIRSFVNQVWKQDSNLSSPHFWNKPSSVCESFEQRRLTTDSPTLCGSVDQVQRTDFFEYYWAHHTVGTKWEHFVGWISSLLICMPSRYDNHPRTLKPLWFILWTIILLGVCLLAPWYVAGTSDNTCVYVIAILLSLIWGFIAAKTRKFCTQYFGDVARYVQAKPANIAIRQSVRKGGIELLERIHQTGDYDRIVLVGHSLGSIVAYDILTHLWARYNKFKFKNNNVEHSTPLSNQAIALSDKLAGLAENCGDNIFDQGKYWKYQRELFNELKNTDPKNNWLITDFVTLGSPLAYADILLLKDRKSFIKRKLDRELPTSPPVTENGHWYYGNGTNSFLHHGAVFGPVKWTNIYMPHKHFIKGDLISGPVSQNFCYKSFVNDSGQMTPPDNLKKTPIHEIELEYTKVKNGFTHRDYWNVGFTEDHLCKLRQAIALYL